MLKISHLVIVLLYMRMRAPRPVTQMELSEHFLIDRKSAAQYLRQLAARHFIARLGYREGYMLAEGGNSMLEKWGKTGHFSLKESFNLSIKDSKDLRKERRKEVGKNWTLLSLELILSESGKLFEKEVISFGLQGCDPNLALALVAHAYDQRDRLRSPAVFVYQRLAKSLQADIRTDQYLPDKKYRLDPISFLPNEYLHALGLAELDVVDADSSDVGNDAPITEAEQLLQDLAERSQEINAVCISWQPISFDQGVLQLRVKSQEQVDRWQRRMGALINDLLAQICDVANPRVQFVAHSVAVETE
jgi:hypothetical protein